MYEIIKTAVYAAAAALIGLVVWLSWPGSEKVDLHENEGDPLFAELKETNQVTRIVIARYDRGEGTLHEFEVVKESDGWVLPRFGNYAADNFDKITEVAGSLIGVKIVKFVSDELGDHRDLGVIAPTVEEIEEDDEGIGTRVMLGNAEEDQFGLIIGNKVETDEQGAETLRYVRLDDENNVYQAKIDPSVYTTELNDWIDENLLNLRFGDVKQIVLHDYSMLVQGFRIEKIDHRSRIAVEADGTDWKVVSYDRFAREQRRYVPAKLAEDEELNSEALDKLKSALSDLNIVDVEPKPKQIADDLRQGREMRPDLSSQKAFVRMGFYWLSVSETEVDLLSDEGEIAIRTGDGVEYMLRFGQIASVGKESSGSSPDKKKQNTETDSGKMTEDDKDRRGVQRYIFVKARFDQDMIERPKMPGVLKEKAEPKEANDAKKPADAKNLDAKQPDVKEKEKKPSGDKKTSKDDATDAGTNEAVKKDAAAKDDTTKGDPSKDDAKKDDAEKIDNAKPQPGKDAKIDKAAEAKSKKEDEEAAKARAEFDRKKAELQYKADMVDYEKKLVDGREKVRKLNEQFADWFYVIPESTYKKIRLRAEDVIKKKEIKKEATKQPEPDGRQKPFDLKKFLPGAPGKN